MADFFKMYWRWIIGIVPVILLVTFFMLISPSKEIKWADWLGFLGGFLAFVGTVVLAFATIKQNNDLNKQNNELILENRKQFQLSNQDNIPMLEYIHLSFSKEEVKNQLTILENILRRDSFLPMLVRGEHGSQKIQIPTYRIVYNNEKDSGSSGRLFKETYIFALKNISDAKISSIAIYDVATRDSFCDDPQQMHWNNKQFDYAITNTLMLKNDTINFEIIVYHDNEYEFDEHQNHGVLSLCVQITIATGYHNYQLMTYYVENNNHHSSKWNSEIADGRLSAIPQIQVKKIFI